MQVYSKILLIGVSGILPEIILDDVGNEKGHKARDSSDAGKALHPPRVMRQENRLIEHAEKII